jgi:hypothetical protein
MSANKSRYTFDAIMADACPEPRSETVRRLGEKCIVIQGLMQAEDHERKRKATSARLLEIIDTKTPPAIAVGIS